jgi:superfamily II DNA/RNA helicase
VKHLLQKVPYKSALVFCGSKMEVKKLTALLRRNNFQVAEMHSDLEQAQREEVIGAFTAGRFPVLVATDILSRGIDIDNIDLVINYDVPHDGEDYVHRIGRTARAQADGIAYTLVGDKEQHRFAAIEKLLGKTVDKGTVPEFLGPVPAYSPRERRSGKPGRKFSQRRKN